MAADRRPLRRILVWLLIIAGVYAGICVLMYLFQRSFLYFPSRELAYEPSSVGLEFEDVELQLGDGTKCHGWWVPHAEPMATVIFCHGNGGNISGRVGILERLHALGVSTLLFDYPGYGKSGGAPTEASIFESAELAWRHVHETRKVPTAKIVLWGRSLGALVIESSFTSAADVGQRAYPFLPVKLLIKDRFDNATKIGNIKVPKLHMHSPSDEVVHYASGRKLFEIAPEPKQFAELRGSHNEAPEVTGAEKAVREFLGGVFR